MSEHVEHLCGELLGSLPARVQPDGAIIDPSDGHAVVDALVARDIAHTLRTQAAEVARLRELLTEAADDLEASVQALYAGMTDPTSVRRRDRDMDLPRRIRALLAEKEAGDGR